MLCLRRTSQAALRASGVGGASVGLRTAAAACRAGVGSSGLVRCRPRAPFSVLSALGKQHADKGQGPPKTTTADGTPSSTPATSPSQPAITLPPAPAVREDIYTLPNILTLSRIAAAPFIGYFVFHDQHAWALGLFAYAGVSDLLDGWIARRWDMRTVVGTILDPMADKMLMTVLVVSLAAKGALPLWVAGIILGRDVGLAISALYYRYISLPAPKTFSRYWDFSLPSAEVIPTTVSKYNTALQMVLVGLTTAAPVLPLDLASPLSALQYVVAATTVWSGASYVFSKDAVKILHQAAKKTDAKKTDGR